MYCVSRRSKYNQYHRQLQVFWIDAMCCVVLSFGLTQHNRLNVTIKDLIYPQYRHVKAIGELITLAQGISILVDLCCVFG